MDNLRVSQLVIFSHSTTFLTSNILLQKPLRFSFQILANFEAAKTGSGVGILRLIAVCAAYTIELSCATKWEKKKSKPCDTFLSLNPY